MAGKLSSFLGSYGVFIAAVGVIGISAGAFYYQSSTASQTPVALPAPDVVPSIAPDAPVLDQTPSAEPVAQSGPTPPKFDVVRVEVDGSTLIAGKAVPHSRVTVQVDGDAAAQVMTDQAGNFVVLFEITPRDVPQVLTLSMVPKGQEEVVSDDSVIIAPTVLADVASPPVVVAQAQAAPPVEEPTAVERITQEGVQEPVGASVQETVPDVEDEPAVLAAIEEAEGTLEDVIPSPSVVTAEVVAQSEPQTSGSIGTAEQMAPTVLTALEGEVQDVIPSPTTQLTTQEQTETVAAATPTVETTRPEIAPVADAVEPAAENSVPKVQQAPTVLLATDEGIRVLQGPTVLQNVVLDSITYDQSGEVQLAGRGGEQGFVRIYLNNAPIQTAQIEESGTWRTPLPDVDTGIYTLRIDQVDEDGAVTSRVETPFLRESAAVLERAGQLEQVPTDPVQASIETPPAQTLPVQTPLKVAVITVQPGSTLWAIAQEKYGDGALYVRVFEANQDNIRNPDLIYPGQVFSVPDDVSQ